jgi:hypothetical protein
VKRGVRHLVLAAIVLTVVVAVGSLIQGRTHAASVTVPERGVVGQSGRALPTAQDTVAQMELRNVQAAVMALMMDNDLSSLPPLTKPTFDMSAFPDPTTSAAAKGLGLWTGVDTSSMVTMSWPTTHWITWNTT